jgi:predicted phosphohydrolase
MKFAAIVPPAQTTILSLANNAYHMALGQWLIQHAEYRNFYQRVHGRGGFIIVDNGAAEPEDERVPFDQIVKAAEDIGADEVVLPDVIRDAEATVEATTDSRWLDIIPATKRLIIPQGDNWDDWVACLNEVHERLDGAYRTIGVAKHLERLPGGRHWALTILKEAGYTEFFDIHLFGIWEDPFEEITKAADAYPGVRGIDSGAPIAFAQQGSKVVDGRHVSLDTHAIPDYALAVNNVLIMMDWAAKNGMETS